MSESKKMKSVGGIAPFGYRWRHGKLVIDETEAPVRKLIYELFLKHRRKKTVAKLLNDLGYRTRNDALFSDTTIDRLLRDTTAKGIRVVDEHEIEVEEIVPLDVWQRANNILGNKKPGKQAVQLFSGIAFCHCGGKMLVPSSSLKYVCISCRHKIPTDDLEEIFQSQLTQFNVSDQETLFDYWNDLTSKERRIIVEQICDRMVVGSDIIEIEFGFEPHSFKAAADGQQRDPSNRTTESHPYSETQALAINEPLVSEAEAAKFLGISKMTLLRRRKAGNIGFFRLGFRVLYSKEKHLLPFLEQCERGK